ncbi:MAG: hypothetical protein EXS05_09820 [Planctomycetaceae bacterium]|nr:hypothetical protein [Planctomycetaceae bacterium]
MRLSNKIGLAAVALLGMISMWASGDEKETTLDKVPAVVRKAVQAKWPKAKIEEVSVEIEDGVAIYEFELEEGEGKAEREWSATFNADGKLLETEEEVSLDQVPKAVVDALQKKYPAVKKPKFEKVTAGDEAGSKVYFEVKVAVEVKLDAAGQIVEEEQTDSDDDDE